MSKVELLMICALQFSISLSFTFLLPLLPLLAAETNTSPEAIGFLMGSNALVFVVFSLAFSFLYPKFGYLTLLLLALAFSCLSILATGYSETYWGLVVVRALGGLHGAAMGVLMAYISDKVHLESMGKVMGQVTGAGTLGRFLGPLCLLVLSSQASLSPDPEALTRLMGWANLLVAMPALITLSLIGDYDLGRRKTRKQAGRRSTHALLGSPQLMGFTLIVAFFWLVWNAQNSFFPLIAEDVFGSSLAQISFYYSLGTLISLFFEFFLIGSVTKHRRHGAFLSVCSIVAVAVSIIAAVTSDLLGIGVALLFFTAASTALRPLLMDYCARRLPMAEKAFGLSVINIILNLAQLLGPMSFGYIYAVNGVSGFNLASLGVSLGCLGLLYLVVSNWHPEARKAGRKG